MFLFIPLALPLAALRLATLLRFLSLLIHPGSLLLILLCRRWLLLVLLSWSGLLPLFVNRRCRLLSLLMRCRGSLLGSGLGRGLSVHILTTLALRLRVLGSRTALMWLR